MMGWDRRDAHEAVYEAQDIVFRVYNETGDWDEAADYLTEVYGVDGEEHIEDLKTIDMNDEELI